MHVFLYWKIILQCRSVDFSASAGTEWPIRTISARQHKHCPSLIYIVGLCTIFLQCSTHILLHHIRTNRACRHRHSTYRVQQYGAGWSLHIIAQLLLFWEISKSVRLVKEEDRRKKPLYSGLCVSSGNKTEILKSDGEKYTHSVLWDICHHRVSKQNQKMQRKEEI